MTQDEFLSSAMQAFTDAPKGGEHGPCISRGAHQSARLFVPRDWLLAPCEPGVRHGGEKFGIEGKTRLDQLIGNLSVITAMQDFRAALGIGAM